MKRFSLVALCVIVFTVVFGVVAPEARAEWGSQLTPGYYQLDDLDPNFGPYICGVLNESGVNTFVLDPLFTGWKHTWNPEEERYEITMGGRVWWFIFDMNGTEGVYVYGNEQPDGSDVKIDQVGIVSRIP